MSSLAHSHPDAGPRGGLDQRRKARLIVGIIALVLSCGYLAQAIAMPQGTITSPGPGMFPVGVGVIAVATSLIVMGESLFTGHNAGAVDLPSGHQRRQAITFMITLVVFILILPVVGQYIAASVYVVASLRFMGGLSWLRSAVYGVAIGAGVSLLFIEFLSIRMPSGMW
jgi:putative tricarboxylic transport membrane protein